MFILITLSSVKKQIMCLRRSLKEIASACQQKSNILDDNVETRAAEVLNSQMDAAVSTHNA